MALWYETGNGMVQTKLARCNIGADVYLCCPGPSLQFVNDQDLHIPNVIVCAINTAYPKIRPDIWIGMDEPECYDRTVWWQPFMKISRGGYQNKTCENFPIKDCPNVFFADCDEPKQAEDLFKLRAHDVDFVWHKNTMAITLHILVWMGAKKIHLLGCDLGGKKDYYDERVLNKDQRKHNQRLYNHLKEYLQMFQREGLKRGIDLISCTPNSPINDFCMYYDLKDALRVTKSKVPGSGKILHVLDVNES